VTMNRPNTQCNGEPGSGSGGGGGGGGRC
jgi:hypothetical protein